MELLPSILLFVGGLVTGVLSGISGGGAGMLMIPLMIAVGLSPQQAVATGKMSALGSAFGGLSAFRKSGHIRKDIFRVMLPIAVIIGLLTPLIFVKLDSEVMQKAIGIILLMMVPTLFIRKKPTASYGKKKKGPGYFLYSVVLTLQSLFGSGVGSLSMFVMTLLFGTSKIEASATKRAVTAVLTPLTFAGLLIAGFVHIAYGIAAVAGSFIGTRFGSKIAIKKGDSFVTYAMAIVVSLSALILLVS
ncbi:MAG TPA: sulfite exporter TauE/SafE family protein [Candidatus Saccharimonadales bacterium]|jgi:uncharacterized membrane protein YfcA|nr:sulfite exporter TauE/SafE family protein [Candidatus Saccharimonadales bacterium]